MSVRISAEKLDFILYAQHGWADNSQEIEALARQLAPPTCKIVAPDLDYIQTWIRIEPLIRVVETSAVAMADTFPHIPLRIIGHSMGGLIWLEVLNRHPEWWDRVHSLVLIASPVGGAHLGRIFDPFSLGLGIARDLGKNRRPMAEAIAAHVPTLVIAGDVDGGSDGTITVGTTQFRHAQFVYLPGLSHPTLRNHPSVAIAIRNFWRHAEETRELPPLTDVDEVIHRLRQVPGIVDAHQRDFYRATVTMTLKDGSTIRTWKNPLGVDHVFVVSPTGEYLYGGFVGWLDAGTLERTLERIQRDYAV